LFQIYIPKKDIISATIEIAVATPKEIQEKILAFWLPSLLPRRLFLLHLFEIAKCDLLLESSNQRL